MSTSTLATSRTSLVPASNLSFIERCAPAVFATSPSPKTSSKYRFYNTAEILAALAEAGFQPTQARQAGTRDLAAREFARHMVRLRMPNYPLVVGNVLPEIVVVNSHGGSCSFHLFQGLHRVECANGLVTPIGDFGHIVVPHRASIVTDVVEAARSMAQHFSGILDDVRRMMAHRLTEEERMAFAYAAVALRYGEDPVPFPIAKILEPRRVADIETNLWISLNVAQERLIRGHVRYSRPNGYRASTRGITSIAEDIRINTGLWHLAKAYLLGNSAAT